MSYKKVVIMELSDIIRRIRDGQSISEISKVTGRECLENKFGRKIQMLKHWMNLLKMEF